MADDDSMSIMREPSRARPVRRVRRALRARDARAGVRGARGVVPRAWADPGFLAEYEAILRDYAGRPSLLSECHNLGRELGVRLLLKREDLNHTGSHKINNVLGQALLAKRMGKPRFIAETGAGQHGVATATAAALMGLQCKVYMGAVDVAAPGAERVPHAPAGRRGRGGREWQPHAQGRRQRRDAGLGRQRRGHVLLPRLGDGPAPLPVDGPRVPPGDRPRGARAGPRAHGTRPGRSGRLRRRWLERDRAVLRVRRHPARASSAPNPPAARPSAAACPASCTACAAT